MPRFRLLGRMPLNVRNGNYCFAAIRCGRDDQVPQPRSTVLIIRTRTDGSPRQVWEGPVIAQSLNRRRVVVAELRIVEGGRTAAGKEDEPAVAKTGDNITVTIDNQPNTPPPQPTPPPYDSGEDGSPDEPD